MKLGKRVVYRALWQIVLASLVFLVVASSCLAGSKRMLWESRDQFVAIESSDAVKGGNRIPNQHPADIPRERLIDILASIQLRPEDKKDPPLPLFTDKSLEILAPYLEDALKQASPDEDVTFAIIGLHLAPMGMSRVPKATAGRLFYQGGKLNLIIGKAQYEFNERHDRRLYPFSPGNREYVAEGDWMLLPQQDQPDMTIVRKDWVAFADTWKPAVVTAPLPDKAVGGGQAAPATSPSAIDRLFSGKAGKTAERLSVLKELRDKGIITEEEYRGKRLTILNEL